MVVTIFVALMRPLVFLRQDWMQITGDQADIWGQISGVCHDRPLGAPAVYLAPFFERCGVPGAPCHPRIPRLPSAHLAEGVFEHLEKLRKGEIRYRYNHY
jgi:hypothetical protein